MQEKFGISVAIQVDLENYLDSLDTLQPIYHPAIISLCNRDQRDYFEKYNIPLEYGRLPYFRDNYRQEKYIGYKSVLDEFH